METITLIIKQGAAWKAPITWASSDDPPVRFNLTGANAAMQIRKGNAEGSVLADLTTENGGIVITSALQGNLEPRISAEDTAALPVGKHPFDLFVTLDAEEPTCILEGFIEVRRQITRE